MLLDLRSASLGRLLKEGIGKEENGGEERPRLGFEQGKAWPTPDFLRRRRHGGVVLFCPRRGAKVVAGVAATGHESKNTRLVTRMLLAAFVAPIEFVCCCLSVCLLQ